MVKEFLFENGNKLKLDPTAMASMVIFPQVFGHDWNREETSETFGHSSYVKLGYCMAKNAGEELQPFAEWVRTFGTSDAFKLSFCVNALALQSDKPTVKPKKGNSRQ